MARDTIKSDTSGIFTINFIAKRPESNKNIESKRKENLTLKYTIAATVMDPQGETQYKETNIIAADNPICMNINFRNSFSVDSFTVLNKDIKQNIIIEVTNHDKIKQNIHGCYELLCNEEAVLSGKFLSNQDFYTNFNHLKSGEYIFRYNIELHDNS